MNRVVTAMGCGLALLWGTVGCAAARASNPSPARGTVASRLDPTTAPVLSPAIGRGWVRLAVEPLEAEISLDGVTQGLASDLRAPASFDLLPGVHRIEVRLAGYETYRAEVHVSADVTETIPVKLRRLPAMPEDPEKEIAR